MRKSRVLQKWRAGKPALLTKINTTDPVVVDMIGLFGFDCVWICMEHAAIDWDRLGHLIRTANMNHLDTMVRVAKGSYSDCIRPLELGATGLMIPHCMDENEARQVANWTRFYPVGRRPLDGGNSDAQYTLTPLKDYMRQANEETFVILQIEDPEAFESIENIAAVNGIDALFVGPADLSQGLDDPGRQDHPRIVETIERVRHACGTHGKAWGLPVTLESAPRYLNMGARLLACGADVLGPRDYYNQLRERFEELGIEFGDHAAQTAVPL